MIGPSAHQARQKMPRHSRWLGAASSALVSRSRAYGPEAGVPSRSCRCAVGHTSSHLLGVRAETGAIPAMGVFAAAALRAAVPAGGRRSKPSPPWRHQLYALSGPSALSASGRGCYSRQPVGGRCPLSTPRHVDQRPRVTRNRHPRQQVAMPWRALRAVSMRNAGSAGGEPGRPVQPRPSWGGMSHFPAGYTTPRACAAKAPTPPGAAALPCSFARRTSRRRVPGAERGSRLRVRSARLP